MLTRDYTIREGVLLLIAEGNGRVIFASEIFITLFVEE